MLRAHMGCLLPLFDQQMPDWLYSRLFQLSGSGSREGRFFASPEEVQFTKVPTDTQPDSQLHPNMSAFAGMDKTTYPAKTTN